MKLGFMKQHALETVKNNLLDISLKYYTENTNKWLWDVCGENPFVEFKEIADFSLAPLDSDLSKGEIDVENCKIIYKNLMFISESQASDERLWAGLTNGVFYDYMRRRWEYDSRKPILAKKSAGEIKTRYFFEGGARGGFYRNTLAKCWWVGRAIYDKTSNNPFNKLDILGSNDISTKITDIFYSNTYSSNSEILDGIVKCFKYFNDEGIKLSTREHVRPTLQLLNAVGGGIILDCLSTDEIAEIMIENIERIMQGDKANIEVIDDDNYIDDDYSSDELRNDEIENELYVALGCNVAILNLLTGETRNYKADYINGNMPPFIEKLIGRKVGENIEINHNQFKIANITI